MEVHSAAHITTDCSASLSLLQAYVNQFKFQSITADDALEFYLEYFPELKKKGVDTIPGQEYSPVLRFHFGTQCVTYKDLESGLSTCWA